MARALVLVLVSGCLAAAACNSTRSDVHSNAVREYADDDRVVTDLPSTADEITPGEYDNIARFGHVAKLRPMVKKALADNVVTVAEYNAIFDANEKLIAEEDAANHQAMIASIKADVN